MLFCNYLFFIKFTIHFVSTEYMYIFLSSHRYEVKNCLGIYLAYSGLRWDLYWYLIGIRISREILFVYFDLTSRSYIKRLLNLYFYFEKFRWRCIVKRSRCDGDIQEVKTCVFDRGRARCESHSGGGGRARAVRGRSGARGGARGSHIHTTFLFWIRPTTSL